MKAPTYQRRYDLDWLRVLAFTLLILFHTGMMFNGWDWHVKNPETSHLFEYGMRFLHQWRMALLFFISGAAIWFAMEKYSTGQFAIERIKRLLVPLVFGMMVVIPPQVYHERLFQGEQFSSFGQFYQTVLELQPYPDGNFSWHHLWYLPYILTFSFLMLPAFHFLKSDHGRKILDTLMKKATSQRLYFFGFVPIALTQLCLRPFWPSDYNNLLSDWANFAGTLIIFSFGFALASSDGIWRWLEWDRYSLLLSGIFTTSLLHLFWYSDLELPLFHSSAYWVLRSANTWFWVLAILAFGSKYLRRDSIFLRYSSQAVYPFYILHQSITVVVGYYLVDWNAGISLKFFVLAAATFFGSWTLYELVIRRVNLLRPLFGLKMLEKEAPPQMRQKVSRVAYSTQFSE